MNVIFLRRFSSFFNLKWKSSLYEKCKWSIYSLHPMCLLGIGLGFISCTVCNDWDFRKFAGPIFVIWANSEKINGGVSPIDIVLAYKKSAQITVKRLVSPIYGVI